jgi:2'-5' RNA ligase
MARHIPAHLSFKSALVLLPPSSIAAPIEAVRRTHDKNFERWPAHINLLYPFLSEPSGSSEQGDDSRLLLKPDIRTRVARAVKDIQPFHISLEANPPGVFEHGYGSYQTVWLGPTTQHVQQLQAALQKEFSEVDSDRRPFIPHLSVGQAKNSARVAKLKTLITKRVLEHALNSESVLLHLDPTALEEPIPIALDWHVDHVCVIERFGKKDRFKVVETINLGEH